MSAHPTAKPARPLSPRSRLRTRAAALVGAAAILSGGLSLPASAQDGPRVLAGPRLDHDCDATVAPSLFYTSKQMHEAIHEAVARGRETCVVHAASRLAPGAPADGPGSWHWTELPEDAARYIVLGFSDAADGTVGWVQLDNRSDAWYYRTNAAPDWQRLMNRERRVLDWGGVAVALYNPPSEGDWSPFDIWYRFVLRSPDAPPSARVPMAQASGTPGEG